MPKIALPFSTLTIVDARFDQSNVGSVVKDLSFKGMTSNKLPAVFPASLSSYFPTMLQNFAILKRESNDTVVMLVKHFRLADHLENTMDEYHEPEAVLTISASFYRKIGERLFRLFSVNYASAKKWEVMERETADEIATRRNEAIASLVAGIFQNRDWTPTQTSFAWTDMEEGIRKRFQLPVYSTTILTTGVYKTFEEFKNNHPSLTNVHFDIKKGRLVQILDENNTPIDMRNYWGACDGKDRYVFFVGLLNKLLPSDKSFCFYTPRKEAKNRRMLANSVTKALVFGLSSNTTVSNKPGIRIKEELLYLNMDNGQVSLEEWAGTEPYGKVIKSLNNGTY